MITRTRGGRWAAAVAVLLASATAAAAQTPAQPAPAPAAAPTGAQVGVPPAGGSDAAAAAPARAMESERIERQLAMLHRRLAITAAQTPQWDAFALTMRENARHIAQVLSQRQQAAAARNAVDDLASYAAVERAHADDVQRLVSPFSDLYATMSESQKRTADAMFRRVEENAQRGGAGHG